MQVTYLTVQTLSIMDITGTIRSVLPEQTGEGKNGIWKRQNIIIQTDGQYPKSVCISLWGDKVDKSLLQEGASVRVHFDLESREFKGNWYTDVKGWKVEPATAKLPATSSSASYEYNSESDLHEDDLPPF